MRNLLSSTFVKLKVQCSASSFAAFQCTGNHGEHDFTSGKNHSRHGTTGDHRRWNGDFENVPTSQLMNIYVKPSGKMEDSSATLGGCFIWMFMYCTWRCNFKWLLKDLSSWQRHCVSKYALFIWWTSIPTYHPHCRLNCYIQSTRWLPFFLTGVCPFMFVQKT